ncbi:hypothetical protein LTR95_001319 [Oleoguttula sp. CCFEE 5521]
MSALQDRSANTSMPTEVSSTTRAPGEENVAEVQAQEHRKVVEQKKNDSDGRQPYISPSDSIMSPASQKLSSFKQKQINKQSGSDSTRRSLFARTMSGNDTDAAVGERETS